jgi:hypothetical protein
MKRFAIVLAAATLLGSPDIHAQTMNKNKMGSSAKTATCSTSDNFAWGIGLGALVVLGVVVGVTVVGATSGN